MLVRICDIVATARHVKLPTKCPSCANRIEAVTEIYFGDGYIDGKLTTEDADDIADFEPNPDAGWKDGETLVVTGFNCGRCHNVLIEGAFHEEEAD